MALGLDSNSLCESANAYVLSGVDTAGILVPKVQANNITERCKEIHAYYTVVQEHTTRIAHLNLIIN